MFSTRHPPYMWLRVTGVMAVPKTSAEKVSAHREQRPAAGIREIKVWVPDLRDPTVLAQLHDGMRSINERARAGHPDERWADAFGEQGLEDLVASEPGWRR